MKTTSFTLLVIFFSFFSIPPVFSQRSDHRDVHRDLEELERQLFDLIEQKKVRIERYKEASNTYYKFIQNRTSGNTSNRAKLSQDIDTLAYEMRGITITLESLNTDIQAIEATIEKLTRYDSHLIEDGNSGRPSGGHTGGYQKAPTVTSVKVVKNYREGPTLIPGKGVGWNNVVVYQVTFSDGSSQTVEDRTTTNPIR